MTKLLTSLFIFISSISTTWACPGCAGSMNNPGDANLVYILSGFILLTYIPFYLIYRTIVKYRHTDVPEK
jgi:hypothetical protein